MLSVEHISEKERASLLYFTVFVYLWKAGKSEYETIIKDLIRISEKLIQKGIIKSKFRRSEIFREIQRLREWRIINEQTGSLYYDLKQDYRSHLNQVDEVGKHLTRNNNKRETVLAIVQDFLIIKE
ncbi:MAG: hypothetical protein ACFFBD_18975 [Candidatus Hodarchaeota archaeon]